MEVMAMSLFDNPRYRRRQRIKRVVACTVLGAIALALLLWFVPYTTRVRIEGPAWRLDAKAGNDTSYTLALDAKYRHYLLQDDKLNGRMSITAADGRVAVDMGDNGDLGSPQRIPEIKDGKKVKGGKSVVSSNNFSWFEVKGQDGEDGPSIRSRLQSIYFAPDGKSAIIGVLSNGDDDVNGKFAFYAAPATSREEALRIYDSINRIIGISDVLPLD